MTLEDKNTELKDQLHILGLIYIGARCRALNNFNRIDQRYLYQRNRAHRAERALRECRNHNTMLEYWKDQLYDRYIKWKDKSHDTRQLILNLNQQILADQYNIRRLNHQIAILRIQTQWFRFRAINPPINNQSTDIV